MKRLMTILLVLVCSLALTIIASADDMDDMKAASELDAVKVAPKHYKVEYENDSIRVLRVTYGPHEKSPMHFHPANLTIAITGGITKHVFPDGTSETGEGSPGGFGSNAAVTHSSENLSDQQFETFLIELKGKEKP